MLNFWYSALSWMETLQFYLQLKNFKIIRERNNKNSQKFVNWNWLFREVHGGKKKAS